MKTSLRFQSVQWLLRSEVNLRGKIAAWMRKQQMTNKFMMSATYHRQTVLNILSNDSRVERECSIPLRF